MSINNARKRSKSVLNENEVLEMLCNNPEYYKTVNPKKIKAENMKKIQFYEQMGVNKNDCYDKGKQLFRNNSVDLYKKRNKEKMKNKDDINEFFMNDNNDQKDGKQNKRVRFLKSKFVTIIEVESYKKYNVVNACKDPYENFYKNNDTGNNCCLGNDKVNCTCFIV
jgi:hypothetical protein